MVDKNGDEIASAVTNLDLHDIARAGRTYGVRRFYVITPLEDQQIMALRIVDHWTTGPGGNRNPIRREAMGIIRVAPTLTEAVEEIRSRCGSPPATVATCARAEPGRLTHRDLRRRMADGGPWLLILGTAWGLAPRFMAAMDHVLEPVTGYGDYNHLSVRSAAAILLDRLLGTYNQPNHLGED